VLPGIPQFIDLISSREGEGEITPMLAAHPFRYADLFFATTRYRLTILVSGDGVKPAYLQLMRVLERNPEAMKPEPLPGYVWLETPGKVLHAPEHQLEFTDEPG
jgi:hypothetical protein